MAKKINANHDHACQRWEKIFYNIIRILFWTFPQMPTPKPMKWSNRNKSPKRKKNHHEIKLQINLLLITSIEFNTNQKKKVLGKIRQDLISDIFSFSIYL